MVAKYTLKSACSQTIAVRGDFVSKQSKTSERNHAVPPVARPLRDLLEIAGALPSDKKAMAWLAKALAGTPSILGAAKQRPLRVDHNDLLADIEKSAKELTRRIQRLRWHPRTRQAFWRSGVFGPVYNNRVEISAVVSTLEDIVSAADSARDRRGKGRPRAVGKQQVIDLAFAFFVRFSPHRPSGTPTGRFATFARAFYAAATGSDPEKDGGLDRQIRQAMTRLSIERERAQQKSAGKSRLLS